ncbi:outer membrane beta-barrel protein [Pontibacter sp. BT731]|uniref:outer membrane beta-barrel protein n=1 Tax=Pontibacter coccineus TaxID=3063328 RepID=UPI0026E34473|nr:outer membrane beta-barrel protein [Pontibacter sp. BT731]MDO6390301.1 outer membrane beta-barrel protein [Pontibacter sp. BT731]
MKYLCLVPLFTLCSAHAFAHKDFQPRYIMQQGDALKGLVDYWGNTHSAFAQLQSGNRFAGIQAGAGFSKPDEFSKVTSFGVASSVGYFVKDKLVVGLSYGYQYAANRQERSSAPGSSSTFYHYESKTVAHAYNIGPMARYYVGLGSKFALFAEGTGGFALISTRAEHNSTGSGQFGDPITPPGGSQSSSTSRSKEVVLYGTVSPGLVFFPSDRLGIELKANVLHYQSDFDRGSDTEANLSLSRMNLGIGYYF